jgi:hypothetical protein
MFVADLHLLMPPVDSAREAHRGSTWPRFREWIPFKTTLQSIAWTNPKWNLNYVVFSHWLCTPVLKIGSSSLAHGRDFREEHLRVVEQLFHWSEASLRVQLD